MTMPRLNPSTNHITDQLMCKNGAFVVFREAHMFEKPSNRHIFQRDMIVYGKLKCLRSKTQFSLGWRQKWSFTHSVSKRPLLNKRTIVKHWIAGVLSFEPIKTDSWNIYALTWFLSISQNSTWPRTDGFVSFNFIEIRHKYNLSNYPSSRVNRGDLGILKDYFFPIIKGQWRLPGRIHWNWVLHTNQNLWTGRSWKILQHTQLRFFAFLL